MASEAEEFLIRLQEQVSGPAAKAAAALEALAEQAKGAKQAAGETGDGVDSLGDKIKGLGSSLLDGASGLLSFGKSIVSSIIIPGIEAHDNLEMMRARLDALAGGSAGGAKALATIESLKDSTGYTRAELAGMAQQLLAIGVPADQLKTKLNALAAQKALGLGGDEALTNTLAKIAAHADISQRELRALAKGGVATGQELADKLGIPLSKLDAQLKDKSPAAARKLVNALTDLAAQKGLAAQAAQAKSFDAQVNRLKEGFADVFSDIDTKPIIDGLKGVVGMFDANTASGREMREAMVEGFKAIGTAASGILGVIKAVVGEVMDLKNAYDQIMDVDHDKQNAADIAENAALRDRRQAIDATAAAMRHMEAAAKAGGATDKQLAEMHRRDQAALAKMKGPAVLAAEKSDREADERAKASKLANAKELATQLDKLEAGAKAGGASPESLKAMHATDQAMIKAAAGQPAAVAGATANGMAVADGMANGIKDGTVKVTAAAKGMGDAAVAASAAAVGAKSPATKFIKLGINSGEGYAIGTEKATPMVREATDEMMTPQSSPTARARTGAAFGGGRGVALEFNNCMFGDGLSKEKLSGWIVEIFHEANLDGEPA